ncbi:type II secretion system minor pseudopilin GspK [Litoribacillus peritrichatus]|uniref:Type II secretion system protein K n=1 Tax=Litoribacillus peritrichatus TaxID=718191 RepID=A0ABP7MCN0_9GAMM
MINKQFNQSGLALVSVLFITALVVTIITAISHRQTLDIQLTGNLVFRTQAFQYAKGAEVFASEMLFRDFEEDGSGSLVDGPNDAWVKYGAVLPMDDGVIEVELWDLQGLYNVNNLVNNEYKVVAEQLDYLDRLFQRVSALHTVTINQEIAQSIADWIDEDDSSTGLGSEEGDYLVKTPAYRTANFYMSDSDELLLIEGVNFEIFDLIHPYLSALPTNAAKLNINLASKELLLAIHPDIKESDIDELIKDRAEEDNEFKDVATFLAHPAFAGLKDPAPKADSFQVYSNYFLLKSRITLGDRVVQMHSVLYRDETDGRTKVLTRNMSKRFNPIKPLLPIN